MSTSIYCMPINISAGIAYHYFISSDGTFKNSLGWGPKGIEYQGKGAELTSEEEQRAREYSDQFGEYNIHSNNCEMFAWYVITGKRYSGQIQSKLPTSLGAKIIQIFQPVLTVRSMEGHQLKEAIARKLNADLQEARKARQEEEKRARQAKLEAEQAARNEFWRKRDAGLI